MPPQAQAALPQGVWEQVLLPVLVSDGSTSNTTSTAHCGSEDKRSNNISQQVVCQLLCSSRAIGRAVWTECSGQLCASFSARSLQQAHHFSSWVTRNASLVRQLHFGFHKGWTDGAIGGAFSAGAPAMVACAIQTAASGSTLQHLASVSDGMPSSVVLNAVHGISSLTSLGLDFSAVSKWYVETRDRRYDLGGLEHCVNADEMSRVCKALSGLSQLQELSLRWTARTANAGGNPAWPALANLPHLTALTTTHVMPCMAFTGGAEQVQVLDLHKYLPPQLQKLVLLPDFQYIADAKPGLLQEQWPWLPKPGDLRACTSLKELRAPAAIPGQANGGKSIYCWKTTWGAS